MTGLRIPMFGFYAILDTGYVAVDAWVSTAAALLDGGAGVLQVRAKGLSTTAVLDLAIQVAPLCASAAVPLIINDHASVALAIASAGLHIGQDDGDPREVRERIGADRILGISTHSLQQAQAAIALGDCIDYFAIGPVFATGTKPDYPPVGLGLLRQVIALQPAVPVYAIGGISRQNVSSVCATGATGVVAVSDVLVADNTRAATAELVKQINCYHALS